jgi:kumamolisin
MQKAENKPENYQPIEGSHKEISGYELSGELNPNEMIKVTLIIRRKSPVESALKAHNQLSRQKYKEQHGASEADLQRIEQFSHQNNFTIVSRDRASRSVILKGRIKDFERVFCVNLAQYYHSRNGSLYRGRTGEICMPSDLCEIVEGVFGLDNRPIAHPMFQIAKKEGKIVPLAQVSQSYTSNEIADIYGFPADATGKNQCIGIIELGGGYRAEDLEKYFQELSIDEPNVKAVSVDDGSNAPTSVDSPDGEVMLDIEVAGAVAPEADIVVYFTSNTTKGFLDAITKAVHDDQNKPSVISISWGAAEENWTQQALKNFNELFKSASALGVTICTAAGDGGSSDRESDGKVHVDFPSSSPYVLSCGGTTLSSSGGKIESEVVWNEPDDGATGGGVSEHFARPDYQQNADVPVSLNDQFKGRGLPDIAGNADPQTGYRVLVDGQQVVIGGTSAVAPLMAGLIARVNEQRDNTAGFINPSLYKKPSVCRDITKGNNITSSTDLGYNAEEGWDACTGWGVMSNLP